MSTKVSVKHFFMLLFIYLRIDFPLTVKPQIHQLIFSVPLNTSLQLIINSGWVFSYSTIFLVTHNLLCFVYFTGKMPLGITD